MLVDETIAEGRDPLSDPQVQSSLYRAESWRIMAHSGGVWAGPIEAIRAKSVTTALAECDVIAEELGLTGQEAAELLIRVRGYLDGCGEPLNSASLHDALQSLEQMNERPSHAIASQDKLDLNAPRTVNAEGIYTEVYNAEDLRYRNNGRYLEDDTLSYRNDGNPVNTYDPNDPRGPHQLPSIEQLNWGPSPVPSSSSPSYSGDPYRDPYAEDRPGWDKGPAEPVGNTPTPKDGNGENGLTHRRGRPKNILKARLGRAPSSST